MSKKPKKLALNRETLRVLNGAEMQAIEGGFKLQLQVGVRADNSFHPACPSIGCTVECPTWMNCGIALDPRIRF
jgi:hypothetical protein